MNKAFSHQILISSIIKLLPFLLFFISYTNLNAEDKIIKIGVYNNSPKIFMSPQKQASGIFIDIIEYIAEKENWKIIYVEGTWEECLHNLHTEKIDIMPDVAFSPERERLYSFHKTPVLSSWSQVYANQGTTINSILHLENKTVAILKSSIQEQAFLRFIEGFDIKINLLSLKSYTEVFRAVYDKKADVAIANNFYGLQHIKDFDLFETGIVFNPSTLFFVTKKNTNLQILDTIEKHIQHLKNNQKSEYYKSLNKWTTENVSYQFPLWAKIFGLIIITALIITTIAGFILKKQVKLRTKELEKSNLEMEQKVKTRTKELAEAMEKALQADQLKSAFLATMSHELRTPLNSIIGFTGILIQELAGPLNDEQKKQLSLVQKSSRHLLALINDILDISKIESGQLTLDYSEFNLDEVIEKTTKIIEPILQNKGVKLITNISHKVDSIYGDKRRIEQILLNLLSNAAKFTEKGDIKIYCTYNKKLCNIIIQDTGIGMEKDELSKLFKPFSQIDKGLTRKYEGSGLGLSICKKLIEKMNGNIKVESTIGKGSIFSIEFPYKKETINE
ncbi:MAG: ATP-binding protein [Candidatus Cloacimonetes bacterium]|nr:ATP-binding protein [Candidatus Cloacimonadota bacterium]MDD4155209.1 ATP-binding protein [Candidatus Cloacimonadota bacterium]